jgi:hypothetical protein
MNTEQNRTNYWALRNTWTDGHLGIGRRGSVGGRRRRADWKVSAVGVGAEKKNLGYFFKSLYTSNNTVILYSDALGEQFTVFL